MKKETTVNIGAEVEHAKRLARVYDRNWYVHKPRPGGGPWVTDERPSDDQLLAKVSPHGQVVRT